MKRRLLDCASALALAMTIGAGAAIAQTTPTTPTPAPAAPGTAPVATTPAPGATAATPSAPGRTAATPPAGSTAQAANPSQAQTPQGRRAEARVEHQINELHQKLHITQAQDQQWNAFATAMRQNAQDIDQLWATQGQNLRDMNALQSVQFYAQMTQTYAQGAQRVVQPFEALYSALSPQQKQDADMAFRQFHEQHERAMARREHGRGRGAATTNESGGTTE